MNKYILLGILSLLSSVLLSLPFLATNLGIVSLFALVPLLCMDKIASDTNTKRVWIWHYSTFVLWNAFTTFWVCNATLGGGLFAIFANAFQMSLIFSLFRFSKKHFTGILPYTFLMFMWIAWEKLYLGGEISWPWLVLGNSFARSIRSVQWYEFTGHLGGSLWIWLTNLSIFGFMVALSNKRWFTFNMKAKIASILGFACLILVPFIISFTLYFSYEEKENPLDVLIVQPNIDIYEKFTSLTQSQQTQKALGLVTSALAESSTLTSTSASEKPLLVLFPETFTDDIYYKHSSFPTSNPRGEAFTSSQAYPEFLASSTYPTLLNFLQNHKNLNLLFGASVREYYRGERPSFNARYAGRDNWLISHNSALMMDADGRTEIFHKNMLVPAVEKTPYPRFFTKIDDALGGVMGRCVGQDSISVLNLKTLSGQYIPIGSAVCYESIYGDYYRGYVKKGAEAMVVITNDAWWGDTPGYKQHLHYASLRSIETRRSIARSANTGISCVINQKGEILEASPWWKETTIRTKINLNSKETTFVKYGDIVGRVSTFMFLLLLANLLIKLLIRRK